MKQKLRSITEKLKLELLENRISLIYIIAGSLTLIFNSFLSIRLNYSIWQLLLSPSFFPILLFLIIFIIGYGKDSIVIKVAHIIPLLLYTTLALIDTYNSFYGLGMFLLMILLLVKYNFFKKGLILKSIFLLIYIVAVIEVSLRQQPDGSLLRSVTILIFIVFFTCFLFVILREDLKKIIKKEKALRSTITYLHDKHESIKVQLEELNREKIYYEEQISLFYSNTINLEEYNLTKREYALVKELCINNYTNKELAYHFDVSEDSIKQFLSRIYTKVGIRRRVELIEKCKPFFLLKSGEE